MSIQTEEDPLTCPPNLTPIRLIKKLSNHTDSKKISQFLHTINFEDDKEYLKSPDFLSFGKINQKYKIFSPKIDLSNTNTSTNNKKVKINRSKFKTHTHSGSIDFMSKSAQNNDNDINNISKNMTKLNKSRFDSNKNAKGEYTIDFQIMDNKGLKMYYDTIRKKINDVKNKQKEEKTFYRNIPKEIGLSLKVQHNLFLKTENNEKNIVKFGEKFKKKMFLSNNNNNNNNYINTQKINGN